ncbi:MAG: DUF1761 domain-containing protein [Patescibacteria group bacterium]
MFYFSDINFLAILISTIAHMILGMLWYSPALFGKQWANLMGFNLDDKESWKKKQADAKSAYVVSFVGALITALVLKLLFQAAVITNFGPAILIAVMVWFGFTGPMMLNSTLFGERSVKLWAIDSIYYLVSGVVMAIILTAWV